MARSSGTSNAKVFANLPPLRFDVLDNPQPGVRKDKHLPWSKCKIVALFAHEDLAEEYATRIPDVHTVAAGGPDIALRVAVHSIWVSGVCPCKVLLFTSCLSSTTSNA